MPARKHKPDEKPQRERFIETARKIVADETPEAFEKAFEKVAHALPPKSKKTNTTNPLSSRNSCPSCVNNAKESKVER